MEKHTQEQWKIGDTISLNIQGVESRFIQIETVIENCAGGGIALVHEKIQDNSYLISAAPDLLLALELFVKPYYDAAEHLKALELARAAIKKARG
jgi:hypothetical protein